MYQDKQKKIHLNDIIGVKREKSIVTKKSKGRGRDKVVRRSRDKTEKSEEVTPLPHPSKSNKLDQQPAHLSYPLVFSLTNNGTVFGSNIEQV
jgi:hypothetical protein